MKTIWRERKTGKSPGQRELPQTLFPPAGRCLSCPFPAGVLSTVVPIQTWPYPAQFSSMGGAPSWVVWLEMGSERTSAPSDHEQMLWEPKCLMLQLELGTRPVYPGLHLSLWLTFILGVLGQSRKGAGGWDALPLWLHVRFQQKAAPYKCLHFRLSFGVWGLSEMPSETLEPWALNQGGEEDGRIHCWSMGRWAPQPTAWGLPKETDVAQLGKQIPSHLSHFSQVMNLAKSTSPSLGQERQQQTQPDGSKLEFWSDSFHSFPASLGHDNISWDFVLIWSTEKPGSYDGDGTAIQGVIGRRKSKNLPGPVL